MCTSESGSWLVEVFTDEQFRHNCLLVAEEGPVLSLFGKKNEEMQGLLGE
jgi:hypothetical protein